MSWLEIVQGGDNLVLLLKAETRPNGQVKHVSYTVVWGENGLVLARVNCVFGAGKGC
jgi:hypothetical protein